MLFLVLPVGWVAALTYRSLFNLYTMRSLKRSIGQTRYFVNNDVIIFTEYLCAARKEVSHGYVPGIIENGTVGRPTKEETQALKPGMGFHHPLRCCRERR